MLRSDGCGTDTSPRGGRERRGGVPGVVQICTVPSWLPVANMNGSAAGFQAMQVMSPPKPGARM